MNLNNITPPISPEIKSKVSETSPSKANNPATIQGRSYTRIAEKKENTCSSLSKKLFDAPPLLPTQENSLNNPFADINKTTVNSPPKLTIQKAIPVKHCLVFSTFDTITDSDQKKDPLPSPLNFIKKKPNASYKAKELASQGHKINLYQDPNSSFESSKYILEDRDGTKYSLEFFNSGDFHKVWKVTDISPTRSCNDILIKTPHGQRNPQDIRNSHEGLKKAYANLLKREETRKDVKVAKIEFKEGYYIVERMYNEIDITAWENDSLKQVRELLIAPIIENPNLFLSDFRPVNVMLDKEGNVVIIDPENNPYDPSSKEDLEEMAIDLAKYLTQWSNKDPAVLEYLLQPVRSIEDKLEHGAKILWEQTRKALFELI